ncbi:MAG: YceI family protein [Chitinophagales bacterium]|nr:YceI family protein [Chitinophagales bacterium]
MKKLFCLFAIVLFSLNVFSQKVFTRNGHISFFSEAPLENIEANNYQVTSIIDLEKKELVFSLLMKGFEFEKALMQEHFNEKYVESDQYPKSTFTGSYTCNDKIDLKKDGLYQVNVTGSLEIHGVTKEVETTGTLEVKNGEVISNAVFVVAVADYNIKIPSVVKDNIAKEIEITVNATYKAM